MCIRVEICVANGMGGGVFDCYAGKLRGELLSKCRFSPAL